jgi:uncharacterized protein (TIRG00374 family)
MRLQGLLGIAISLAALAWVFHSYDLAELGAALAGASPAWLALAFAVLAAAFLVRALRWRGIFPPGSRPSRRNAFASMMVGYLLNNVMPARAGELAKVYLLGRAEAMAKSMVLGTVIVEKSADLAVFALLLVAATQGRAVPGWIADGVLTLTALGAVAVAALLAFQGLAGSAGRLLAPLLGRLPARIALALRNAARSFLEGVRGLARPAGAAWFVGYSAIIWLAELAIVWLVARAFGLPLGAAEVLFVLTVIVVGTMIPSSPGYIGTFEVFGVMAMKMLGYAGPAALGFVVTLHATSLLGSSVLGALSLAAIHKLAKHIPRASELLQE